jgi:hypothetical protein
MSSWASQHFARLSLRGLLWFGVLSVLLLSYFVYAPQSATRGAHPGLVDWVLQSWPALFAMALAIWLLLQGPLAFAPSFVQKAARLVMLFFTYAAFLYLLKWNPLWNSTQLLGLKNRNMAEGFLILASTLVWFVASIRVLFRRSRVATIGPRSVRQEETRHSRPQKASWFNVENIAIFTYLFRS